MNVDYLIHISVLEEEIKVLQEKYKPAEEGTGHYNTAIYVLKSRIDELKETKYKTKN